MESTRTITWARIDDYPNYEVSDRGDVRNIRTNTILGRRLDKDGYRHVQLYLHGNGCNKKVHRLVAQAFIPHTPERDQINHKNGNKEDNRVENLEWCTRSENTRHAYDSGLLIANIRPAIAAHTKLDSGCWLDMKRLREAGVPVKEIAQKYDVSIYYVYRVTK